MESCGKIVFLFDIDGTLLLAGALAEESYRDAFAAVTGKPYSIRTVDCSGRTDPWIVREVLLNNGHGAQAHDPVVHEQVFTRFLEGMRSRLERGFRASVLDGVTDSLAWLEQQPGVVLGLLTGNLEAGARIKLEAASITTRFSAGAYGSDHHDRNQLGPIAKKRLEESLGQKIDPDRVWIVGDSVHDIACARAAGFRVMAVASGSTPAERLASANPDCLVETLSVSSFQALLGGLSRPDGPAGGLG
ncbi:MAG TPA: HAD family hydrolase [Spirochaetota bacterium]|nr:HAD family hydrolase [Spirochaetota bacterium]